jgi:branched-chain amino acid transport system substrate-binding protein
MFGRGTRRAVVALAAALAVLAAACSDDSGDGSGGATDEPAAELTGEPIKLITIGAYTAFGNDYTQIPEAAQAAADAINADGGVNGSPIEIIVCDYEVANRASDCGRQAVDEGVMATVGAFSADGAEYQPFLEEAGIPQVAIFPVAFEDYTSPMSYPVFGGALSLVAGMGAQLADAGAETISVAYLDIAAGELTASLAETGAAPRGGEVVTEVAVPEGTVEYSPQIATATEDDPEGLVILLTTADAPAFLRQLRQAGYDGQVATSTSAITSAALDELGEAAEGLLLPSGFKPSTLTDDDTVQQFNDEMDEYAPADATRDDTAQNAWVGVHLVAQMLDGMQNPTPAKLRRALETAGTLDLGLVAPFSFEQGVEIPELAPGLELRVFNTYVVYTVAENGEQVAVDNGEFVDALGG